MRMKRNYLNRAMRIGVFLMAAAVLLGLAPAAFAAAGNNNIKIYEIAGAGGLSGATYRQDTIILFNPTAGPITMNNWSIQLRSGTASATTSFTMYKLPVATIPAGGYYMIAASSPTLSTYGSLAPIPYDYRLKTIEGTVTDGTSGDNIISSTTNTIALANNQTAITANSTTAGYCPTSSNVVDLVGFGSNVSTNASTAATPTNCWAGAGEAYYDGSSQYGRQMGIMRKNKCTDTFSNSNDFVNVPVTNAYFLNSATTPAPCPTGTQLSAVVAASPANPGVTEAVTFTAAVTPATLPSSTGITAYVDFNSPYYSGSAQQMYDDGTHGDVTAGDGIYTLATTIPAGTAVGYAYPTNVTISDAQGDAYWGSVPLTIPAGTITMTSPTTSGTVNAGGALIFPITITGQHGYGGVLDITCTGTPNTNTLGVPISTQCVSTPPEVTIANDGTATISLAIATGTTVSAGLAPRSLGWGIFSILAVGVLSFGIWRRRQFFVAILVATVAFLTLTTTACGTSAGIGNTSAAPGTYTYTVTATDTNLSTIANSLTFTITVK